MCVMVSSSASCNGSGSARSRLRARLRRSARDHRIAEGLLLCLGAVRCMRALGGELAARLGHMEMSGDGSQRGRDLLLLPLVTCGSAFASWSSIERGRSYLAELVSASAAGINDLHGGTHHGGSHLRANAAQQEALQGIGQRWWQLGQCLARCGGTLDYDSVRFMALVGRKLGSAAKPMVASDVDVLPGSAHVDAQRPSR